MEYAENQTRLYLTCKNDGESDFAMRGVLAQLAQGSKQYEEIYVEGDCGQFPDAAIMQGVEQSGIIFFDALDQNEDFTVKIYGWPIEVGDDITYEFNVSVN